MRRPVIRELLALGGLALFPSALVLRAGDRALGGYSFDQAGHLWAMWHASVEPLTTTLLLRHPEGLDLMPALGGWADILLGGLLTHIVPVEVAYNVVIGLYLWLAGAGGHALARVLGAGVPAAMVAGVLLQTEPILLRHAGHGQVEQVGYGMVGLAIAGAVASWHSRDRRLAVLTGLAGAAVVYISWEYAALLAGAMLVLGGGLCMGPRTPTSVRQWGRAAMTTVLVAGPWAGLFLLRTTPARTLNDDGFNLINAAAHSLPLLDWLWHRPGPGLLLFAPLLLLPWTARRRDRAVWVAVGLGLLLSAALAAGPDPRLSGPPNHPATPVAQWWAPFSVAQQLPVFGWYHWPDRIITFWPLAAAPAMALLIARVAACSRALAVVLATLVLAPSLHEAMNTAPRGRHRLPDSPALAALAAHPSRGGILDLPVGRVAQSVLRYQLFQIRHRRPIPLHSFLSHLHYGEPPILQSTVAQWSGALQHTPPGRMDFLALRTYGVHFVAVHRPWLHGVQHAQVFRVVEDALGEPMLKNPDWACWEIPAE